VFVLTSVLEEKDDAGEGGWPPADVLERLGEISERLRRHALEQRALVDERNELVLEAIDRYRCSHRQVARATGLSVARVHGILARD